MEYQIKQGFLRQEFTSHYKEIYRKYKDLFSFADKINQYCHDLLFNKIPKIEIGQDEQKKLVLMLYSRILETFQGIIILTKRGMMPQAKMLTRCMIESGEELYNVANYENYVEIFNLKYIERENLRAEKKISSNKGVKEINKKFKTLKNEINKKKSELSIEESEFYKNFNISYSLFSKTVHPTMYELLFDYYNLNDSSFLKYGPNDRDMNFLLIACFGIIMYSLKSIDKVFSLSIESDINRFDKEVINFTTMFKN